MKHLCLLIILISFSAQADDFFKAEYGEQPDHLTPMDYPPDAYDQKIIEHLFLTSGRLGRFISRPSFGVESCVSVYEKFPEASEGHENTPIQNGDRTFFITTTQAVESIWHAMRHDNKENHENSITVTRTDREISLSLATAIQRAWGRMLQHTKYPAKVSLGMDGTTYQFSVWAQGFGDLNGETWSPDKGLTAEMVEIGKALADFSGYKMATEEMLITRLKEFESKIPQIK